MALKIEIIEPGLDSAVIDLENRVDQHRRVTIGRPLGEKYPHLIRLSKATGMVSAFQFTFEIRGEDDDKELWVRDGGQRGQLWKPSTNGTTFNSELLASDRWTLLRVNDVLRIGKGKNAELTGFAIKYATSQTIGGTLGGAATTSFGAVDKWRAEVIVHKDIGVLLLRWIGQTSQLVIEKMDYVAEELLGGQPGELIELSGRIVLGTLINERDDLETHAKIAMQQRSPATGFYTGSSRIKLILNCVAIDGRDWIFGYLYPPEREEQQPGSWQDAIAQPIGLIASRYPVLFVIGLVAALGLGLVVYLLTK